MMKKLTVLLHKKYRPLSIAAILDVFETVNTLYENPVFEITIVKANDNEETQLFNGMYSMVAMKDAPKADLVLIPAFLNGRLPATLEENRSFIPWLQQQYRQGAEIGSFCTGAFLLAASGLLNNRRATSHVAAISDLSERFPEVIVAADVVVTEDAGLYTSGGATSSFHLMLHIIEKYCDRQAAIRIAKVFAIDMDRDQQSYFADWNPTRHHQDDLVSEAQQRMEKRFKDRVTVEEVIRDLPVSRRNFIRRFKMATGVTPIEYLQRIRIEAAKKLLEQKQENITGVMMNAGYEDAKAFRQVFRRIVGLSPKEYREKYAG